MASIWGVSGAAVGQWSSDYGCPRNPDKTYRLADVVKWHENWEIGKVRATAVDEKNSPALERKRMADAKLAEIKLAREEGKVLELAIVEQGRLDRIREVKRTLLTVPRSVAARLAVMNDRVAIERVLRDKLTAICEQFARK